MEKFQVLGRFIAMIVGIGLIVVGVRYAMLLFGQIYGGLTDPASVAGILDEWARFIVRDLDGLEHNSSLSKVEHLRIISLFIIAVGGVILTWLTIHMIVAGARVVQIAATSLSPSPQASADPSAAPKVRKEPQYNPLPPRQQDAPPKRAP